VKEQESKQSLDNYHHAHPTPDSTINAVAINTLLHSHLQTLSAMTKDAASTTNRKRCSPSAFVANQSTSDTQSAIDIDVDDDSQTIPENNQLSDVTNHVPKKGRRSLNRIVRQQENAALKESEKVNSKSNSNSSVTVSQDEPCKPNDINVMVSSI